ncbi:hypothetical protein MGYG_05659 [Nannizzia gypsea CBS 118893]|uniref:Uncharacterized protein n=1 Tax=Arthroderma gypseum (strain ATCC MYA-4604 / CBS 118893) TaxID=535722 RepID=E4UX75_ARTGP|nr:hypothetical protein MGYG_05659 [Nannizzia gypsea CBS 118893]EFR02662.1 hypothetical protein MGYG_05659 [Nannizzia gypsea CBS 118893]
MGRRKQYIHDWVGDRFDNHKFTFSDQSQWLTYNKISEKGFVIDYADEEPLAKNQAVYNCRQTKGPSGPI